MTRNQAAPKKLKVLRILAALILMPILFLLSLSAAVALFGDSHAEEFEKARSACQDELWIVRNDSPFTHIEEIKNPGSRRVESIYPDTVMRYACSQEEARSEQAAIEEYDRKYYVPTLIVIATAMYGAPVFVGIVVWWMIEEFRFMNSRKKS